MIGRDCAASTGQMGRTRPRYGNGLLFSIAYYPRIPPLEGGLVVLLPVLGLATLPDQQVNQAQCRGGDQGIANRCRIATSHMRTWPTGSVQRGSHRQRSVTFRDRPFPNRPSNRPRMPQSSSRLPPFLTCLFRWAANGRSTNSDVCLTFRLPRDSGRKPNATRGGTGGADY